MKTKDLMIRDYVQVSPSMMPIKIAAIHQGSVGYYGSNILNWVREALLEPIELTPEILIKNGLKPQDIGFFDEDKEANVEISIKNKNVYWTINYWEYTILKLNYVHELQHVLKLYEIEKEIEL